jgi:hypothetical protein
MALCAATHVPAQLLVAVVFDAVLIRRGLLVGAAAGTLASVACSAVVADLPNIVGGRLRRRATDEVVS